MIKLGSLADLSSIREPISNVGNLTGRFCHRNFSLWKNEPKWLVLKSLTWLESRLSRGRERSSLLVHALSHSHFASYSLVFLYCFLFLSMFLFFLVFRCSYFFFYYAQLRPFYTVCHDKIHHFTLQLLLACYGCPSLATHWSTGCPTTTTTLCWLRHAPFPEKGNFVLSFCSP